MNKLKLILVIVCGLGFSLEAFSEVQNPVSSIEAEQKAPDMNQYETDEEGFQVEIAFEEEQGVDISSEDLDSTFMEALASR